jgi:ComF family protein
MRFRGRLELAHALAYLKFKKKSKVQHMLHALKYYGCREIGYKLGLVYGEELKRTGISLHYDLITSVSLHVSRLRQRGYNQSDEWARGISETAKIPLETDLLIRKFKTITQAKRSKIGRWENVSEVFELKIPGSITNKRILLVDDVVTTGSTIESCGIALIKGSSKALGVACLAVSE